MYKVPNIVLIGYGRTQAYQVKCLKCKKQFFPGKEAELFCDECLSLPGYRLEKYLTKECFSRVPCLGNVVGWENIVGCSDKRSRHNYRKVYRRDDYTCQYCGYNLKENKKFLPLHIDHVIPHSYGGGHRMNNLVVSCSNCNQLASNKVFNSFEDKKKYILQQRLNRGLEVSDFSIRAYELVKEDAELYLA